MSLAQYTLYNVCTNVHVHVYTNVLCQFLELHIHFRLKELLCFMCTVCFAIHTVHVCAIIRQHTFNFNVVEVRVNTESKVARQRPGSSCPGNDRHSGIFIQREVDNDYLT